MQEVDPYPAHRTQPHTGYCTPAQVAEEEQCIHVEARPPIEGHNRDHPEGTLWVEGRKPHQPFEEAFRPEDENSDERDLFDGHMDRGLRLSACYRSRW